MKDIEDGSIQIGKLNEARSDAEQVSDIAARVYRFGVSSVKDIMVNPEDYTDRPEGYFSELSELSRERLLEEIFIRDVVIREAAEVIELDEG